MHLDLRIRAGCSEPYIEFHVDGHDLGARIRQSLGEAGFNEVLPWPGGDYSISETVLGEAIRSQGGKKAILLACGCGCSGCSSVHADVDVADDKITFSNFVTWHWGGPVRSALDPITFDRGQFEGAVARLQTMLEEWRPPDADAPTGPPPQIRIAGPDGIAW